MTGEHDVRVVIRDAVVDREMPTGERAMQPWLDLHYEHLEQICEVSARRVERKQAELAAVQAELARARKRQP